VFLYCFTILSLYPVVLIINRDKKGRSLQDIVEFLQNIIVNVTIVAWIVFFLTWVIGWAIKGMPIPFIRIKRTGERFIEDAVWAAFWLAMGSSVFALIAYLANQFYEPLPEPPTI